MVDKDNLLRRTYELLWHEHRIVSTEVGEGFELGEAYHQGKCDVCSLLKEIDELPQPTGSLCDCHSKGGTEGKHLLIDIV